MSNKYYHCVWDAETSCFKYKGEIYNYEVFRSEICDPESDHAVVAYLNFYSAITLITNVPRDSKDFESVVRNALTVYYDFLENHKSYLYRKNEHKKAFQCEMLLHETIQILK